MKKLSIVGTVGLPAKYGGFETMVENIIPFIGVKYECTVYCSKKSYRIQPKEYNGVKLEYINIKANGIQSIFYDIVSIVKASQTSDAILVLGVSGCVILPLIRVFFPQIKLITNIDGLEWKREKWPRLAKIFLKFSEFMAVKFSHQLVCDNQLIVDYVRKEYGRESKLIAYGGDHVYKHTIPQAEAISMINLPSGSYFFFVARIEPENNIHQILKAFTHLHTAKPIVGVGNWDSSRYGRALKQQYRDDPRYMLLDAIYDQKLLNAWRSNAYAYIHGHSAGGTNPSLVEAMSLGLPVIAFDVGFNRSTTGNQAIYFKDESSLFHILQYLHDEELVINGKAMLDEARKEYRWELISNKYCQIID